MMEKNQNNEVNRRNFIKSIGAAGLGPLLASAGSALAVPNTSTASDANAPAKKHKPGFPQVPRRKLGKTGIEVSSLSLGTMFNVIDNQAALRESLKYGVTYWDTAHSYSGGNSEIGIGKFLSRNPELRKELFIVSKASGARTIADVENRFQESLKRMKTDYIDLYYGVHILSDPARLTEELKAWARNAKKRKLIRFFGFSTHSNMARCLTAGAKLDWIDAILVVYNWRLMQDEKLNAAIDACYKAGIGLTAMKTQGRGQVKEIETEGDKKVTDHFIKRGFTAGQAKIKAVLADKRISSVAVGRGNISELRLNVAAALDKTELTADDMKVFKEVARTTCSGYCAGCAYICDPLLPDAPYVRDIMRYLMYYNSYGEKENARKLFAGIPPDARDTLLSADYSRAELCCPQHLPIAKLVAEAAKKLA